MFFTLPPPLPSLPWNGTQNRLSGEIPAGTRGGTARGTGGPGVECGQPSPGAGALSLLMSRRRDSLRVGAVAAGPSPAAPK